MGKMLVDFCVVGNLALKALDHLVLRYSCPKVRVHQNLVQSRGVIPL